MPSVKEIKYGEDNSIDNAPKLTEEEEHSLKKRIAAMDALLSDQGLAKYKIEIMFQRKRSLHEPMFGLMSFWGSGAKFHGGGDTKMYLCPGKDLKKNLCEGFIPDASTGYGFLVCPSCKEVWKGEDVSGEIGARLGIEGWATLVMRYFYRLDANADIYVKYPKFDIRQLAQMEQEKQLMGEKLVRARMEKQLCIYPLKNIVRDTANGADLHKRFVAFLRA